MSLPPSSDAKASASGDLVTHVTDPTCRREHAGVEVIGMVEVTDLQWGDDEWRAHVRLREGVYALDHYRVVLTCLGPITAGDPQGQALRAALREVIRAVVTRQMRRGSLPPRAMVVNWRRVVDRCYAGDSLDRVRPLIARIDEAVPLVSQADTRGYFHAMAPARPPTSPHTCRDAAPSPPTARAPIVAAASP